MRTWPLRWRIAAWSALATALALATFTAVVVFNLYHEQVEMIDVRLSANAALVDAGGGGVLDTKPLAALMAPAPRRPRIARQAVLHGFALMRTADGALIQAQPASLARAFAHWPPGRWPPRKTFLNATIGDEHLRVGAFPRGETTLLLAASLEPAEESVQDLLEAALVALPFVLLVVAGGSWWIAGRTLRPVREITRAAASITADRLGERLPAPATLDEIGRHVVVLNGMFDRLQRSFEQATRFTADAAHELRTPLTIMRGQIEEALRTARADAEQERLLLGLLEETANLQKIADNLLLLARFDVGKNPLQFAPVDLSALLQETREDAELLAAPRRIKIQADIAAGLRVSGDATLLRRVALNLVDNAVKFNRADGRLELALQAAGREAVLTIGNTGPVIPAERQGALFERFFRVGADRNRDAGGSGLGLSLCREIVSAHGGRILLGRSAGDWTEFRVHLPLLAA
ncbi:MAG TPA: ATP-binding protein [Opitutaceae bacterium]|nr:ATP-binding protein [Opitutaceae bacterium]